MPNLYLGTQKVCPVINVGKQPSISSLSVTPTTSQQTINAPSGTDGYSPITVSPVTSSIDSNITAGNIKSGVSILGVTGTYEGGSSGTATVTVSSEADGGAFERCYILINDNTVFYSRLGPFQTGSFSATVPKGKVTITCIAHLGNDVIMELHNESYEWNVVPDHDGQDDVAVVSKTLDVTENTTVYLYTAP